MSWFSRKREIAELRKQIAQLAQALHQHNQPAPFDAGAFINVLMDGQVKQIGSTAEFIRMVHDIATERMASAMGRRGGKKRAATAARDARGRMLPGKRADRYDCVLCNDPNTASFTTQEFEEHQRHKNRAPRPVESERIEPTPEERAVIERQQPSREYPLPYVERAASGNEADRSGGDSQGGDAAESGHRNGIA